MTVHDLVVDTFDEDVLESVLGALAGNGRIVRDQKDPDEPWLTEDGYLVVRFRDVDPAAYSREVQRRVRSLRVVGVYDRTPREEPS